jgi:hypothetical protein
MGQNGAQKYGKMVVGGWISGNSEILVRIRESLNMSTPNIFSLSGCDYLRVGDI